MWRDITMNLSQKTHSRIGCTYCYLRDINNVGEQILLSVVQSDILWCQSPVKCQNYLQNSRYNFLISIFFLSIYFVLRSGFTFIWIILIHTLIWNVAINMAIAAINTVSAKLLSKINTGFLDKKPSLKHHKIRFNFKRWAEDIS